MGQTNIPLNSTGIEQAKRARNRLKGMGITTICHSPLARAQQTAEIFNEVLNCNLVSIDELQEFNIGSHAGQKIESWIQDWRLGAILEGAESYSGFIERSLIGINKALSYSTTVLIISHGGVYWSIEHATQVRLDQHLPNCAPALHLPPKSKQEKWTISLI